MRRSCCWPELESKESQMVFWLPFYRCPHRPAGLHAPTQHMHEHMRRGCTSTSAAPSTSGGASSLASTPLARLAGTTMRPAVLQTGLPPLYFQHDGGWRQAGLLWLPPPGSLSGRGLAIVQPQCVSPRHGDLCVGIPSLRQAKAGRACALGHLWMQGVQVCSAVLSSVLHGVLGCRPPPHLEQSPSVERAAYFRCVV